MTEQQQMSPEEAKLRQEVAQEVYGDTVAADDLPLPATAVDSDANDDAADRDTAEAQPKDDDMWTGLNPALRDSFEAMRTKLEDIGTIATRLKQAESRIGGITNTLHEERKAREASTQRARQPEGKAAPTSEEIAAAAESDELLNELKEEFPAFADIIDAQTQKIADQQARIDDLEAKIGSNGGQGALTDKTLRQMREELRVEMRHPDWEQVVKSQEYDEWARTQPLDIIDKMNSDKAEDAIAVLDAYKAQTKGAKSPEQIENERKKRLSQSELPAQKSGRKPVVADDNLTDEQYRDKLEKELWQG